MSPISVKIQLRRDSAANWTSVNPTLAPGEIGVETDTGKFKIGHGSAAWTLLPYATADVDTHPDRAAHDALGLATDIELAEHAASSHGTAHPDLPIHDALGLATDTELAAVTDAHVADSDPHTGYQKEAEKGAVSGYASLDTGGKVPTSQMPPISFGNVFPVASEAAMLALDAAVGDIAIRSDISQTFILSALPASAIGNWQELLTPAGGVTSVNTRTGSVTGVQDTAEKGAASGYAGLDAGGTVPDAQLPSGLARDAEVTSAVSTHEAAADPHAEYQKESEKGAISGYASLDAEVKVPVAQLPTGTTSATVARGDAAAGLDATHAAAADPHTGYVLESLLDAKGDLFVGSADNTPARVGVGANNSVLTADSSLAAGVKWADPPGLGAIVFALAGTLTVGAGTMRFYNDTGRTLQITSTRASVGTAPTGSSILLDFNINGITIWSTQSNRITIPVGSQTDQGGVPNTLSILSGQYVTCDIDQVGSSVAGTDLSVVMWVGF